MQKIKFSFGPLYCHLNNDPISGNVLKIYVTNVSVFEVTYNSKSSYFTIRYTKNISYLGNSVELGIFNTKLHNGVPKITLSAKDQLNISSNLFNIYSNNRKYDKINEALIEMTRLNTLNYLLAYLYSNFNFLIKR